MLAGEKRWASTKKGGMTVLGKVAVPKPINLPSKRLENHGLDPNVEIVPKGAHGWGSRSSSNASNAWGSSTLSPGADGGTDSPSYLSGRPSSSGSGRPSTGGSDRTHEPVANAWGSNSRPSSASGSLNSNQTSLTSLRPHSAETRPGSSQLSRFAESPSDNSMRWGSSGTAEKLGMTSSKNDGFSLSSGDFPTLGSEKEKQPESQEHGYHGRPGSSFGQGATGPDRQGKFVDNLHFHEKEKVEMTSSWGRDNLLHGEDGPRPNMKKWHGDPQSYPQSGSPPQHYNNWRGPLVNHPSGLWHRGPPGGPPFGSVPPGGFPMDPFPYYRQPIPPPPIANPQAFPPSGSGPRGPVPKNEDMYRHHIHDMYMHPRMPVRPGFFPGPIHYEGNYGPPIGFCNANDRDIPFMGMAVGPAPYNRYVGQTPLDPGSIHGIPSGYGPGNKSMVSEKPESGHLQESHGSYRAFAKHQDSWEEKDGGREQNDQVTTANLGNREHPRKPVKDTVRMVDNGEYEENEASRIEHSEEYATPAISESSNSSKTPSLIQKIEGLNAKTWAPAPQLNNQHFSSGEMQTYKSQGGVRASYTANEVSAGSESLKVTEATSTGNTRIHKDHISSGSKSHSLATAASSVSNHGVHDHRAKFNIRGGDGRHKKFQIAVPSDGVPVDYESHIHRHQHHNTLEAKEKAESHLLKKDDGQIMPPASDPSDTQEQRAKMRELAMQRFKQREKEEEERLKDQKAKADAKLEELNRRTKAGQVLTQNLECAPNSTLPNEQEDSVAPLLPDVIARMSKESSSISCYKPYVEVPNRKSSCELPNFSNDTPVERPSTASKETSHMDANKAETWVSSQSMGIQSLDLASNQSSIKQSSDSSQVDASNEAVVATQNISTQRTVALSDQPLPLRLDTAQQAQDSSTSSRKSMGYSQQQSSFVEKNTKNQISFPSAALPKSQMEVVKHDSSREPQKYKSQKGSSKVSSTAIQVSTGSGSLPMTRNSSAMTHEDPISAGNKNPSLAAASLSVASRTPGHGVHGRADYHCRGKFSTQGGSGWHRKFQGSESSNVDYRSHDVHRNQYLSTDVLAKSESYPSGKDDGETLPTFSDLSDAREQRAKMTEQSKQQFKQEEKEEKERMKDKKTKAGELEERKEVTLDDKCRSAQAGQDSTQELETAPNSSIQKKREEFVAPLLPDTITSMSEGSSLIFGSNPYAEVQSRRPKTASKEPLHMDENKPIVHPQGVDGEAVSRWESSFPDNSGVSAETSVHHRRKNGSSKTRRKGEDALSKMSPPQASSKDTISSESENIKPKTSNSVPCPASDQSIIESGGANQLDHQLPLMNEEFNGRSSKEFKSQHSHKMPRNMRFTKSDRIDSSDSVVWAPVQVQNKTEIADEDMKTSAIETYSSAANCDKQVQKSPRNKRAELERYIPKPVAKEMAQHGNVHPPLGPSDVPITSSDLVGSFKYNSLASRSSQNSGTAMASEPKNGDHSRQKSGKVHGWKQRASTDRASSPSDHNKNVEKSLDLDHSQKPDVSSVQEQPMDFDGWNSSDGWNALEGRAPVAETAMKTHGVIREKRQSYRVQKSGGYRGDSNEKGNNVVEDSTQILSGSCLAEFATTSKDGRAIGERVTSHWLPKSQSYSATDQQRSRPSGGQSSGSEADKANRTDINESKGQTRPELDKDTIAARTLPPHDQSESDKISYEGMLTSGQEGNKERKISHKAHSQCPTEPRPNKDFQHDKGSSSGFRRYGNQNSRFSRDHKSQREWTESTGDNKQDSVHGNREKQRRGSHYEYLPVGQHNKVNAFEPSKDGSSHSETRPGERGQTHSRRGGGNSYDRRSGGHQVDTSGDERY